MLNRLPLPRSLSLTLAAGALLVFSASAQAPHPLTDADRQRIDEIVHKMTLAEKLKYIGGNEMEIFPVPSAGVRALEMSDGPVGVRLDSGFPSTTYAGGIALAATWDPKMAERVGAGIGRDARARGINFMLGPAVNIYRSPRNGRNFEYFGEDPFWLRIWLSGISTVCRSRESAPRSSTTWATTPSFCATIRIRSSIRARCMRSTCRRSRPE